VHCGGPVVFYIFGVCTSMLIVSMCMLRERERVRRRWDLCFLSSLPFVSTGHSPF